VQTVELLAPVGHWDGLLAAVGNGADAIYVGGPLFGARVAAAIEHKELEKIIEFCHLYSVKAYVTINTTIIDSEITQLTEYIHFLYQIGADAVIVQDLGVLRLVRELYPEFEIHISTQMHIHNQNGVKLLQELGASRIVVARENSINEIKNMVNTGLDIEVFVHGALCYCYSGQCLMSSMNGGRSGNRGACAQPCRLKYELMNLETDEFLQSQIGDYLLSPKDLNTVENIGQLIEAGVTSFKIEGRLKKAEYVATVVKAYRTAIDQYQKKQHIKLDDTLKNNMTQSFNRTFTTGFLHGESGKDWIGAQSSGHRGVEIGKVVRVIGQRATVLITKDLHLHDGLKFIGKTEEGMEVQKMFVNGQDVKIASPGYVDLMCNFIPYKDMTVFKTTSSQLKNATKNINLPRITINGEISIKKDFPIKLSVWDLDSNLIEVESENLVEFAQNEGIDLKRVEKQLFKTGNTPFSWQNLTINLDEKVHFPISSLNELRRTALEKLELIRKQKSVNTRKKSEVKMNQTDGISKLPNEMILTVSVRNLEQLKIVLENPAVKTIYYKHFATLEQAITLAQKMNNNVEIVPQFSRVMDNQLIEVVKKKCQKLSLKRVMVAEYGTLNAFKDDFEIETDYSFNANNSVFIDELESLNVKKVTLGYELNAKQIKILLKKSALPVEMIVYTRIPLMISKHCPIKTHYQGNGDGCKGRYCRILHGLKNSNDEIFPLMRESRCHVEMLDSKPLNLIDQLSDIKSFGVAYFRLDFTIESASQIREIISHFSQRTNITKEWLNKTTFTTGHYNRGIF